MQQKKKFIRLKGCFGFALGVTYEENPPQMTRHSKGVFGVRSGPKTKFYLDLDPDGGLGTVTLGEGGDVDRIEIPIPEELRNAPHGEVLLHNSRTWARVRFGRDNEDELFGFSENQWYIPLCLYAQENLPSDKPDWEFVPLYVQIDKGQETTLLCLTVRWENDVIVVEINHNPSEYDIPSVFH